MPIAVVAERTGLSVHTLRYYEKAGLVESVRRNAGGQRRYAAADLDWLSFLLMTTGTYATLLPLPFIFPFIFSSLMRA